MQSKNQKTMPDASSTISSFYHCCEVVHTDPDPAFWAEYRSGTGSNSDPGFGYKLCTYPYSLGLHKGFPSYTRSLQPSNENIQHLKTWNF
jgi:hypothetical protein